MEDMGKQLVLILHKRRIMYTYVEDYWEFEELDVYTDGGDKWATYNPDIPLDRAARDFVKILENEFGVSGIDPRKLMKLRRAA